MTRSKYVRGLLAGLVAATSLAVASPSSAHEPYYPERESAVCDKPKILKTIKSKFGTQAKRVHMRDDWHMTEITGIHQHRYIPQDAHADRAIPRRYCHADAHFNDGSKRAIWYLVEGGAGFAGFGNNVEFCVEGLDRWNVHNAHCRILR